MIAKLGGKQNPQLLLKDAEVTIDAKKVHKTPPGIFDNMTSLS